MRQLLMMINTAMVVSLSAHCFLHCYLNSICVEEIWDGRREKGFKFGGRLIGI